MRALRLPQWPRDADVAVSLTFDGDREPAWLSRGEQFATRLSTLSEVRFNVVRGLSRIPELLNQLGISGTFCVTGLSGSASDWMSGHTSEPRVQRDAGHLGRPTWATSRQLQGRQA
jgi:hypothetical protein